jgi:hypothetical protein
MFYDEYLGACNQELPKDGGKHNVKHNLVRFYFIRYKRPN